MYLINGQWHSEINASDRAIQFGDGCFTTARISSRTICHQQDHLRRLQQACEVLLITEVDWQTLAYEMSLLARETPEAVLKVILTRGSGGRGYSARHCDNPTRILSVFPRPAFYDNWREQGVQLALSPVRLGQNSALAGIKHLNRLEQVLIRTHLDTTDAQEALVLDSEGQLVECCAANLFWRKGGRVFTPYVDKSGINGTMRQRIIACLENSRWRCEQVSEPLETLADADEVLICNALMPVIPVRQAENWYYPTGVLYHFLAPLCE